jgi:DNA end-binding protein Ku
MKGMTLRATVTGTISFGLAAIPVKFYLAASDEKLSFNQISPTGNRVKQKLVDAVEGTDVSLDEVRKGYEFEKGRFITFTKEEFEALEMTATKMVTIKEFIPADQLDVVAIEKSYYLGPDKGGDKGYLLLSEAMKVQGKVAIAQWSTKGREHLCCIRPYQGGLLLQILYYAPEIRAFSEIPIIPVRISDEEMSLANLLLERMSSASYDPSQYKDTYHETVQKAVETKIAGQEVVVPKDVTTATVVDMMEALKMSIEAAKKTKKPTPKTGKKDKK